VPGLPSVDCRPLVLLTRSLQQTICIYCRDYGDHKKHKIDLIKSVAVKLRAALQTSAQSADALTVALQAVSKEALTSIEGT
jgi:hypothetical protein